MQKKESMLTSGVIGLLTGPHLCEIESATILQHAHEGDAGRMRHAVGMQCDVPNILFRRRFLDDTLV